MGSQGIKNIELVLQTSALFIFPFYHNKIKNTVTNTVTRFAHNSKQLAYTVYCSLKTGLQPKTLFSFKTIMQSFIHYIIM